MKPGATTVAEIVPGVWQIDTHLSGWSEVTAAYLLTGESPLLVETGSATSSEVLLSALSGLGVGPGDLAAAVVTHIHLDHAGGIGEVAVAFPDVRVLVHPAGVRHLVDPSRLVASALRVFGDRLDGLYGRMTSVPADRVAALADGDRIQISPGRGVICLHTPGHARHHLSLFDTGSGLMFTGDSVGLRLPGMDAIHPALPPPDFDLVQTLDSIHRMAEHRPERLALAHFGVPDGDPQELLAEAGEAVRIWAAEARRARHHGEDIQAALGRRFTPDINRLGPGLAIRVEALNGVESNAAGLARWLELEQPH
ncbi:MAG: MBL fold metallo-hydrolase [Acidimicrobiales bacterium]